MIENEASKMLSKRASNLVDLLILLTLRVAIEIVLEVSNSAGDEWRAAKRELCGEEREWIKKLVALGFRLEKLAGN